MKFMANHSTDRINFDWITNEIEILRWAKKEDITKVIKIAINAFKWVVSENTLIKLWEQKIGKKILAVAEINGEIKGFIEVIYSQDPYRFKLTKNIKKSIHEYVARKLLCHKNYFKKGPYLLYVAVEKSYKTIGLGARMINLLKKYNDEVSVLCLKNENNIINYYMNLGFKLNKLPMSLLLKKIIGRKYIYLKFQKNQL
jgi:hypothetical protein